MKDGRGWKTEITDQIVFVNALMVDGFELWGGVTSLPFNKGWSNVSSAKRGNNSEALFLVFI